MQSGKKRKSKRKKGVYFFEMYALFFLLYMKNSFHISCDKV